MGSSLTKGTVRVQVRKDTAYLWGDANPTLAVGEFGFETNTGRLKIGDGSTAWTSLEYIGELNIGDGDGTKITLSGSGDTLNFAEGVGIDINHTDTVSDDYETTITCDLLGEELSSVLLATGNATDGHVLTAVGDGSAAWEAAAGGTQLWNFTIGGYKTNNNSDSFYYTQSYPNFYSWTSSDNDPTSLGSSSAIKQAWTAPAAGKLNTMRIIFHASDTGLTDPFKFYVYKGTVANNTTSTSLTLIATSSTCTPIASRTMLISDDFSSGNTFSANDSLSVWVKKDSTSGNQDIFMNVTLMGEYT